ncbi:MAG: hypothetical protein P4N60_10665 [Verrucomicrobiae bacterium]|nr:hypothetical protein [Verrucomicrobiae bacterium]
MEGKLAEIVIQTMKYVVGPPFNYWKSKTGVAATWHILGMGASSICESKKPLKAVGRWSMSMMGHRAKAPVLMKLAGPSPRQGSAADFY